MTMASENPISKEIQNLREAVNFSRVKEAKIIVNNLQTRIEDIEDDLERADLEHEIGRELLWIEHNPNAAQDHFKRALEFVERKNDSKRTIHILNSLGLSLRASENHEEAVETLKRALKISKESNDKSGIAKALYNLANTYKAEHEDTSKREDLFKEALAIQEELGDYLGMGRTLYSLSSYTYSIGDYKKAQYYISKLEEDVIKGRKKEIPPILRYSAKSIQAVIAKRTGELKKAKEQFISLKKQAKVVQENDAILWNVLNLGDVYRLQGNYSEAKREYESILEEISKRECATKEECKLLGFASSGLAHVYWAQGSLESAEQAFIKCKQNLDSEKLSAYLFADIELGLAGVLADIGKIGEAKTLIQKVEDKLLAAGAETLAKAWVSFFDGLIAQAQGNLILASQKFTESYQQSLHGRFFEYELRSLVHLSEITLLRYQQSLESTDLDELNSYVSKIKEIANSRGIKSLLSTIHLIKGLLLTVEHMDYDSAILELTTALEIAKELDLRETIRIEKELSRVQKLRERFAVQATTAASAFVTPFEELREYISYAKEYAREARAKELQ